MISSIFSISNCIEIKLLDDCITEFNSLKQKLGYNFFHRKDLKNIIRFSHFDFFLNLQFIIGIIKEYNINYDSSFKLFVQNIKQNKFLSKPELISEDKVSHSLNNIFKRKLKPFQFKNVQKLVSSNSGATFSVPGAGKTSEILATYSYFKSFAPDLKLLVISPKNAVSAWDEEITLCLHNHNDYNENIKNLKTKSFRGQMAFITDGYENAKFILDQNPDLSIITYDSNANYQDILAEFLSKNNVMCAVDESHRIKSFPKINSFGELKGSRSYSVLNLSGLFKHKFIMSGPPMPQNRLDLKSQFGFLFPERISNNSFYNDLKSLYVRTTKKDIGLLDFNAIYIDVKMSSEHQELYDKIKNIQLRKFESRRDQHTLKKLKRCIMYLLQVSSNPRIVSDNDFLETVQNMGLDNLITESSNKFKAVCDLTNELVSKNEKVLIWTNFKMNIDLLKHELSHFDPVIIDGRVGAGEVDDIDSRKFNINKFKNDPNCKVFIANPAAASEGISLHINGNGKKVCSNAIYLDRNFNCSQFLQSVDRIHRIGSKETPNIYIFRTLNSVDMRVQDRLDFKVAEMMKLLNDSSLKPYINNNEFYPDIDKDESVTKDEADFYYSYLNNDAN